MGDETWKPVVGFEGWYSVSDQGRVRRDKPGKSTFRGRILKSGVDRCGYPGVNIRDDKRSVTYRIHRLVADAFIGVRPVGLEVNHKNGVKTDNRVENLEYVTRSENCCHAFRVLGRKLRAGLAKLNPEQVSRMRLLVLLGFSHTEVGKLFGLSRSQVWRVVARQAWRQVS